MAHLIAKAGIIPGLFSYLLEMVGFRLVGHHESYWQNGYRVYFSAWAGYNRSMNKLLRGLIDLVLIAGVVAGGYYAYSHHNQLLDWYYLRNYTPPTRIAAMADQATLTDSARRLFYRGNPQIDPDRSSLSGDCHIQSSKSVELGCYLSTDRIFLLDIADPNLVNQMTVTAAHETLHAAYNRLGGAERKRVNALLEQTVATISDQDLTDRLTEYARTEPGARDDELHSILGTEFGKLPPALEQYYAQYFTSRATVVALSDQFKQTFDGLHTQIVQLDSSINSLRAQMNAELRAGQISAYNSHVPIINREIDSYNQKVDQYNRYANILLGAQSAAAPQ